MHGGRFVGYDGIWYRPATAQPISAPPESLRLGRFSNPWLIYRHILGVVIITFLIANCSVIIWFGLAEADGWLTMVGGACMLPLVAALLAMTRPRVAHVRIAVPAKDGEIFHALPDGTTLRTPVPTRFAHHLIRDDSSLDTPPSRTVWILFAGLMSISIGLSVALLSEVAEEVVLTISFLIIVPAWLLGFSIPVLAWWSHSSEALGIDTRRRDAESWLIAGMLSAIPAMIVNSFIAPSLIPDGTSIRMSEFLILTFSAPIGEEICKGAAAALFIGRMRGRKHGFQIGFTVGLGFAMLENLQYVLFSFGDGYAGFTFTALIRGLGSIPGHAFWTGLTGFALGALSLRLPKRIPILAPEGKSSDAATPWLLVDPDSGELITHASQSGEEDAGIMGADFPRTARYPMQDGSIASITGQSIEIVEVARTSVTGQVHMVPVPRLAQDRPSNEPISLTPSDRMVAGLGLAMLGHATWNGTAALLPWLLESIGSGDFVIAVGSLLWISCLVTGVLMLGRWVLRGVRDLEEHDSITTEGHLGRA